MLWASYNVFQKEMSYYDLICSDERCFTVSWPVASLEWESFTKHVVNYLNGRTNRAFDDYYLGWKGMKRGV